MPDAYLPRFLSREGLVLPGERRRVTVPAPAAGADWSVIVPGGRQWRIMGGGGIFTTSAVVANRFLTLTRVVDGVTVWATANGGGIAASLPGQMVIQEMFAASSTQASGNLRWLEAPDYWLQPGDTLAAATISLQAGDQWGPVLLDVEEVWLDDQELTKLHEQQLAALGVEQTPWGPTPTPGG